MGGFFGGGGGGGETLAPPDLVFIADTTAVGEVGYDYFDSPGGTLIFASARLLTTFGIVGFSLETVAPSEMELRADGIFTQDAFATVNIYEWAAQSLPSSDALFQVVGSESIWHWNNPEASFIITGQYTIRFTGP